LNVAVLSKCVGTILHFGNRSRPFCVSDLVQS